MKLVPHRVALSVCGCLVPFLAAVSHADELPVTDGLMLRVSAADPHADSQPIDDQSLTHWPDVVPGHAAQQQLSEEQRPTRVTIGNAAVLRFDGKDDCLQYHLPQKSVTAATVVVLAAPHENPGDFRAFVAANRPGERDYQSGFNIDLGPAPGRQFDAVNIEGPGFSGAQDLAAGSRSFGQLTLLETQIDPTARQVRLRINGEPSGRRGFEPQTLSLDHVTLGARVYNNSPGAQEPRGFLACDIAEVLIYDRVLSDAESQALVDWVDARYGELRDALPGTIPQLQVPGVPLVKQTDAPVLQMLLPGFTVRELPVELTNVNNLRYREDGKLVTLGYNGDIHLLSDTDGDGLEDHAELFWKNEGSIRGPIGLALTPPDYPHGRGMFVPSKGKVSLIVDQDGDDRADREIVIASGWQEIPQNVDAVGIALDDDHNIYFALGTANYADAYLIGDDGTADYDINSDRGTVQKVSADFSSRETVCTGVRFPVAMAFNRHGDLFCTDQEGATWLPNGNPFDELLHIQPDRHYGFPPRHPQHNPDVIDEPSTFDYSPQHQSTCGLVFNESVNGGPVFGPEHWAGDAIVCGESRGRLWRTSLVPTDAGYVASSQPIASLQMLTVDACVSPEGALVVACHSGPPDWGTGPAGIGRLFRVEPTGGAIPRPVAAWAEGPQEIRIAFDQPLDPLSLQQTVDTMRVEYGRYVRAADRFENLAPPYSVVHHQTMTPRFALDVQSVSLTSDLRTVIVHTSPLPGGHHVAITLPRDTASAATPHEFSQLAETDLELSLTGVQATWRSTLADSEPSQWAGWLPHLDLSVSRRLTHGSHGHQPLWSDLSTPGELTLETQLDLHNILRPAVQPGATIDYRWPAEQVTATITASHAFRMEVISTAATGQEDLLAITSHEQESGRFIASFTAPENADQLIAVRIILQTGGQHEPELSVAVHTNEDSRPRPLPLNRLILPWVDATEAVGSPGEILKREIPELAGGSWARGRRVFQSESAGCFKCHDVGGDKASLGPNLANLVHRDYASVVRDITNPGFAINPDYITHAVVLNDGRILTGVIQSDGDEILIGDEKGKLTRVSRHDVELMKPSSESVMPKGIPEKIPATDLRDLLTYLLTSPPSMPLESPLPAPPLRTRAEVDAALAGSQPMNAPPRPLNILLVAGPKDHGPGEHDYPAWQTVWEDLLSAAENVTVTTAWEFPSPDELAAADVTLFFQKGTWNAERASAIDAYLQRGGGLVYIHWAVNGDDNVQQFSERIGYASWGGRISYRHGPLSLEIHNRQHPIVRNFDQLDLYDESYWKLTGDPGEVTLLATSFEDGMATPQLWVTEARNGRVFVSIPGHYSWTFDDPLFRILMLRGIAWTADEPVDRFNDLVTIGARMTR